MSRDPLKNAWILVLVAMQHFGCTPPREISRQPHTRPASVSLLSFSPYPSLKKEIDGLLSDSLFPPSDVGIKIVSLDRQEVLYELNSRLLFNPASNQKLFTAATALGVLGREFRVKTIVNVDTTDDARIFLQGLGDPLLTSGELDSMAKSLKNLLPPGKIWRLSEDVSYFDSLYWGSGWAWDDEPDPRAMFISPLSVDNNTIRVSIHPGIAAREAPSILTTPSTTYVTIENAAQTITDSVLNRINISRGPHERKNTITVTGEMRPWDSSTTRVITVWKPERYAVELFAERLRAYGVGVEVVRSGQHSVNAFEAVQYSRRVDSIVTYMNKVSDNLSAENLLKILGAEQRGVPGSAHKGNSVVKEFLSGHGFDTSRVSFADGSGVSRYNLLTAESIIDLLRIMYKKTGDFEPFYASLPVAGEMGSLSKRMKGTLAQGNLRAKTGTLTGASSLSGYVRTVEGELLAFSILMQNFMGNPTPYRHVQDSIGLLLSEMRRKSL